MSILSKHFYIGLGSGIVLMMVLIPLTGYLAFQLFVKPMESEFLESRLRPPDLPYGKIDYDWSVLTLDGAEVTFSRSKGKPVFLNFWATSCPHCVAEMKSIQNLYDSLEGERLVFMIVSQEDGGTVRRFIEKTGFTFPVYVCNEGLPKLLRASGVPTTFISDRTGTIVVKHTGSARWDHDSCLTFIRALAKSEPES